MTSPMTHIHGLPEEECFTCPEGLPEGECERSLRPCGHHCNHSWEQDLCHWCGTKFVETEYATVNADRRELATLGEPADD